MRIFIGYDEHETVAYHVLAHSILKRSSIPVSIWPLRKELLKGFFNRPRGEKDSTDFAITRFLVPYLSGFKGYSLFLDADMLVQADIAEMQTLAADMPHRYALKVVKHDYTPSTKTKFLDQVQTVYQKKNWSSVMLFNNEMCPTLTPEYVEKAHGLDLHQFKWTSEALIGELPKEWNWLVGEYGKPEKQIKNYHYTVGTPCFPDYASSDYSDLWYAEFADMCKPCQI